MIQLFNVKSKRLLKKIMYSSNVAFAFKTFSLVFLFIKMEYVYSAGRHGSFRSFRFKPSSYLSYLSVSPPPRLTAARNFNSNYEPPFMMSPPHSSGTEYVSLTSQTPSMEYGPPTTTKPIIHKHVYVHIPPPEPDLQVTR